MLVKYSENLLFRRGGHFPVRENEVEFFVEKRDPLKRKHICSIRLMDKRIYRQAWFVYIAECRDNTLYVGVAKDVEKRISEHNNTKRCRYTRFRKPVKLKYRELHDSYGVARRRESEIKKFSRKKKLALIDIAH